MVLPIFSHYSFHWTFQLGTWSLAIMYQILFIFTTYRIKKGLIQHQKYQTLTNLAVAATICLCNFHIVRFLLMISGHLNINTEYRFLIGNLTNCLYAILLVFNICIVFDCCIYYDTIINNHPRKSKFKYAKFIGSLIAIGYLITPGLYYANFNKHWLDSYYPIITISIWCSMFILGKIAMYYFIRLAKLIYSHDIINRIVWCLRFFIVIILTGVGLFWACSFCYYTNDNIYIKSALYFVYFFFGDILMLTAFVWYLYKMKKGLSPGVDDVAERILRSSRNEKTNTYFSI